MMTDSPFSPSSFNCLSFASTTTTINNNNKKPLTFPPTREQQHQLMTRLVKREPGTGTDNVAAADDLSDCRILRSRYHAVQNLIQDEADDIGSAESNKFNTVLNELQSLHERVIRPREQLADAEALLGITSSLLKGAKLNSNAVTPSKFINFILRDFARAQQYSHSDRTRASVNWQKIGISVSHIFKPFRGCSTMLGTNSAVKQRKPAVRRGRRPSKQFALPKQVDPYVEEEEKTGTTDGTMLTMFSILRKERKVELEHLVLNRGSFSQTVENLFALSFLVKDGRVEIQVDDESRRHLVSPRNAPSATMIASGDVAYRHFVFKFDYSDWQLMCSSVGVGKELMPHRTQESSPSD